MRESRSEQDGLDALLPSDLKVLSVGVSTAGEAEIKMIEAQPDRTVIATTLDPGGAELVRKKAASSGYVERIDVRIEDIASNNLPYDDEIFDFVYARLVLHYLSAQNLETALANIHRILKRGGRTFIVVRSTDSDELRHRKIVRYDDITHMTTYVGPLGDHDSRYFHTTGSISSALVEAGFQIERVEVFDEEIASGFDRQGTWSKNNLIEVIASKP